MRNEVKYRHSTNEWEVAPMAIDWGSDFWQNWYKMYFDRSYSPAEIEKDIVAKPHFHPDFLIPIQEKIELNRAYGETMHTVRDKVDGEYVWKKRELLHRHVHFTGFGISGTTSSLRQAGWVIDEVTNYFNKTNRMYLYHPELCLVGRTSKYRKEDVLYFEGETAKSSEETHCLEVLCHNKTYKKRHIEVTNLNINGRYETIADVTADKLMELALELINTSKKPYSKKKPKPSNNNVVDMASMLQRLKDESNNIHQKSWSTPIKEAL